MTPLLVSPGLDPNFPCWFHCKVTVASPTAFSCPFPRGRGESRRSGRARPEPRERARPSSPRLIAPPRCTAASLAKSAAKRRAKLATGVQRLRVRSRGRSPISCSLKPCAPGPPEVSCQSLHRRRATNSRPNDRRQEEPRSFACRRKAMLPHRRTHAPTSPPRPGHASYLGALKSPLKWGGGGGGGRGKVALFSARRWA